MPKKDHGLGHHPLYKAWCNIKDRCCSKNYRGFKNYGGRGIQVCDQWKNDFKSFYNWAILRWKPGRQIDRIDNDEGYSPENCRFVTRRTNNSHRKDTSKYGVNIYKQGKKYQVKIYVNGKTRYLGSFTTQQEARKQRDRFLKNLRREES
jgi:hypothetical protein